MIPPHWNRTALKYCDGTPAITCATVHSMPFIRVFAWALLLFVFSPMVAAQNAASQAGRGYVAPRRAELVGQFIEFLAIPNVAADPAGLRTNADYLVEQLKRRGVEARL